LKETIIQFERKKNAIIDQDAQLKPFFLLPTLLALQNTATYKFCNASQNAKKATRFFKMIMFVLMTVRGMCGVL